MSFLETLSKDDPVARYVAAYQAVGNYVDGIQAAGPPADGNYYPNAQQARAALLEAHSAADSWPNGAAARCKEIPANITNWDPQLKSLIADLKLQAQPPLTDAKKKMIAIDANNIVQILGQDAGEFSGVVSSLASLTKALLQAHTTIIGCDHTILNDIGSYRQTQGQLMGQLQAEVNKACPSQATIAQLKGEIGQQQSYIDAARNWDNTVRGVYNLAVEALPSANFLQSFWQGIGQGVVQASAAAKKLPQDPEAALLHDIQQIANTWSRVQQEMATITQRLR